MFQYVLNVYTKFKQYQFFSVKINRINKRGGDTVAEKLDTVKGEVEDITYTNEINGYTVCVIDYEGEMLTLVGTMPFLGCGETITAMGKFTNHPTFGRQFKVEHYEKELPATESSMISYLASGAVKGIGPVLARRIVDKFGKDTFDVLEKHPEYLEDIKGVTRKKAREIGERFNAQFGMRNVMMYFNGIFSTSIAMKVYKRYGDASVDIIKRNPYILCEQISGIGFERADAIARQMGIDEHSHLRIEAGMKYILKMNLSRNGNCYLPSERLVSDTVRLLGVTDSEARSALRAIGATGEVVMVKYGETVAVYIDYAYRAEKYCAEKLKILSETSINIPDSKADRHIEMCEAEMGITFADLQRQAIKSALDYGMLIVTGGPGTGKTTVIRAMIKLFDGLGMDVLLAAPTGRAAKRMTSATDREARTIHRLLESGYATEDKEAEIFGRDEDNPLECDALIVDEISMCDIFLLSSLLRAVKPGTKLIFLGDSDQLPPVGAGDTLRDMIGSGAIPTVRLNEVFRQGEGSDIVFNAHNINNGRMPALDNKSADFFFMKRTNAETLVELICSLCSERLAKAYGYDPLEDIQVITPTRKGYAGTANLNSELQKVLNPYSTAKLEKKVGDIIYREGDKIMQIKNNYSQEWSYDDGRTGRGVYNGEIGLIERINTFEEYFDVNYDGRKVRYDLSQFDEVEHAYAVTVHKSQGSEYPCVVIPVFDAPPGLLTRNMLYTAVTRAKNNVILVGRSEKIQEMVENNSQVYRYTGLLRMLKKENSEIE